MQKSSAEKNCIFKIIYNTKHPIVSLLFKLMFIKVFGERNTGTHFLIKLLRKNTNAELLVHPDGASEATHKNFEHIIACYPDLVKGNPALRSAILERLIDSDRSKDFSDYYGWKHAAVNTNQLKQNPKFEKTLFICLIRNPWRFISALHRRPYNLFPQPFQHLTDFIQQPLIMNSRDNLIESYISSPVELWNKKTESYLKLKNDCPTNVVIAYYEDVICDVSRFLNSLQFFCEVKSPPKIPNQSTKRDIKTREQDKKTFSDYKDEVERYSPLSALGDKACNLIAERIDKYVFRKTYYAQHSQYSQYIP